MPVDAGFMKRCGFSSSSSRGALLVRAKIFEAGPISDPAKKVKRGSDGKIFMVNIDFSGSTAELLPQIFMLCVFVFLLIQLLVTGRKGPKSKATVSVLGLAVLTLFFYHYAKYFDRLKLEGEQIILQRAFYLPNVSFKKSELKEIRFVHHKYWRAGTTAGKTDKAFKIDEWLCEVEGVDSRIYVSADTVKDVSEKKASSILDDFSGKPVGFYVIEVRDGPLKPVSDLR